MNILHLCRQYHPSVGGVERFVAELAARTAARGHTVEVATLNRVWRSRTQLPAQATVNDLPVHRLPFIGGALFFAAPGVLNLFNRFDILHVHNTDFFLDYAALTRPLHHRPVVVSTHGGFFHTPDLAAFKRLYFALITRRSLRAASVVIPNSANDERHFAQHARRAVRIDNAIDYESLARVSRRPTPGRLLTVGRLAPNKNLPALLNVFAAAYVVRPDLSLVVAGDSPLRTELQTQATRLGVASVVQWLGEVSDEQLRTELAQAEVFLSAASYEGFGLALLEAMAAGVVPVVNDIEAFRDVIEDGQNGFLAEYGNSGAAVQKLLAALGLPDDQKQLLSERARETAGRFDWKTAVNKFEEVYALALQPSSKRS